MSDLELAAARWLKWEKKCPLVLTERTPRYGHGQPDVLGITAARYLLEIEVKRSMSDFRANQLKHHMQCRFSLDAGQSASFSRKAPKQFWFMVPEKLVEKVQAELPDFAGLMTMKNFAAVVIQPSRTNDLSERLSIKECAKLMNVVGNQIISCMSETFYRKASGTTGGDSTEMDDFYFGNEAAAVKFYQTYNLPRKDEPKVYTNYQI